MAEADNDLIKKHLGSRAMYGRLQYIILIGTAGPDLARRTWKDVMFACAQYLLV